jgi:hypothetical protein
MAIGQVGTVQVGAGQVGVFRVSAGQVGGGLVARR